MSAFALVLCSLAFDVPPAASDDIDPSLIGDGGETVVSRATRSQVNTADVPASVTVLKHGDVEHSPTLTTDELLRTVPSAATFRRSSSLVADPSSQGLNLRGLGPSGASRSLLLVDGVPMNDPFGGWIYWRSLPRLDIESIEIMPTAGSALWGTDALGGVVQIASRPITPLALDADVEAGSAGTLYGDLRGADLVDVGALGKIGASLETAGLKSDGYPLVAPSDRGPIDKLVAPSVDGNLIATATYAPVPSVSLRARAAGFRELESGGTTFTDAGVTLGRAELAAHADLAANDAASGDDESAREIDAQGAGTIDAVVYGEKEQFDQTRARVPPGRTAEHLAGTQRVPADEEGASFAWTSPLLAPSLGAADDLGSHSITAGLDGRRVSGTAFETIHPAQGASFERASGGDEDLGGAWVGTWSSFGSMFDVTTALRLDGWILGDGRRVVDRRAAGGQLVDTTFPDRAGVELSPRAGVLVKPFDHVSLRASIAHGFRAPTLNELYRPFQVRTVLTDANASLTPEHVWGTELGASIDEAVTSLHLVGFWNELTDPIINATLSSPLPDGATQQRKNLGAAFVRGFELTSDWHIARVISLRFDYTYLDSRVISGPAELIGKQLAQDPQNRATAAATFDDARIFTLTLEARALGSQFEDDRNTLVIPGCVVVDAALERELAFGFSIYAAVDNALDTQIVVGRAGVTSIGEPFMARAGIRFAGGR